MPITGPTFADIKRQVVLSLPHADLLEFRFDLFDSFSFEEFKAFREELKIPLLFTLRNNYSVSLIEFLASLDPTFFDLDAKFELIGKYPSIQWILSYHDFIKTPQNLEKILKKMQHPGVAIYKIACRAESTLDGLRMLELVQKHSHFIGICMGEKGSCTRILGPLKGKLWGYAYHLQEQKTAEGQLSISELRSVYNVTQSKRGEPIFGLIGSCVDKSMGHFAHNSAMEAFKIPGIYLKMSLQENELAEFFSLAPKVGFLGLSVTMPFKEKVIPFLDFVDSEARMIGAVNTLLYRDGRWIGYNTDGKGALDALEAKVVVRDKRIAILGAGGAAQAICFEAQKRGALVTIYSRSRGRNFADLVKSEYDILINTMPEGALVDQAWVRNGVTIMDINAMPKMTPLLTLAMGRGCQLVFGYEMFIHQAVGQQRIWFENRVEPCKVEEVIRKVILEKVE